jgi:hypothetical protein
MKSQHNIIILALLLFNDNNPSYRKVNQRQARGNEGGWYPKRFGF